MTTSTFDRICVLLTNYDFPIDDDTHRGVKCGICGKIMLNPYKASCECHYCYKCIKDYVGEEKKCCPGDKEECTKVALEIEENVYKDAVLRRNIALTSVTCPNKSCAYRTKLESMEDHIRVCTKKSYECPYKEFGCSYGGGIPQSISEHLSSEGYAHAQLMIQSMHQWQNELNIPTRERELDELSEGRERNTGLIENLRNDLARKEEIIRQMKEDIDNIKCAIVRLEDRDKKNEHQNITKTEEENAKAKEIRQELDKVTSDVDALRRRQDMNEMTDKNKKATDNNDGISSLMKRLILNVTFELVWLIDQFCRRNGKYDSESFHKDDYHLRLQVDIDKVSERMDVYAVLMPGERDDVLQWPMKQTIRVRIINQESLKTCRYWNKNYDSCRKTTSFNRPQQGSKDTIYLGGLSFIEIRKLLIQDSLLVCCSLST